MMILRVMCTQCMYLRVYTYILPHTTDVVRLLDVMAMSMKVKASWGLMQCDKCKFPNISEKSVASILRVEAEGISFLRSVI